MTDTTTDPAIDPETIRRLQMAAAPLRPGTLAPADRATVTDVAAPVVSNPSLGSNTLAVRGADPINPTIAPSAVQTPRPASVPDPNDPKYQALAPHGAKRVLLTLGAGLGGSRLGPLANEALHAPQIAYGRDVAAQKEQLATANTQSEIDDRTAQAGERATKSQLDIANAQKALAQKPESEPKTVDTGDGVYQYNEDSGRYDIKVGASKATPPAEVTHTYEDGKGNEVAVLRDGSTKILGPAKGENPPQEPRTLVSIPQADGSSKVIEAKPGVTLPKGAQTISEFGKSAGPTADETRRSDLAENLTHNLDVLEEIATRRPDLFGPISGRITQLKGAIGSSDPDLAALETAKEQIGMAQLSAHGMRSGAQVEQAAQSILNGYKNGAGALRQSIKTARDSVKTFTNDVERKGGSTGGVQPGAQTSPSPTGAKVIKYDTQGNRIP